MNFHLNLENISNLQLLLQTPFFLEVFDYIYFLLQNLIIQLPVPPATGNDQDRKRLAESFFLLFRTIKDLTLHSVVIPVFSGYDPSLFADIALSSVSAFLHRYPEYFIQLVFACRDNRELEALSASEGE